MWLAWSLLLSFHFLIIPRDCTQNYHVNICLGKSQRKGGRAWFPSSNISAWKLRTLMRHCDGITETGLIVGLQEGYWADLTRERAVNFIQNRSSWETEHKLWRRGGTYSSLRHPGSPPLGCHLLRIWQGSSASLQSGPLNPMPHATPLFLQLMPPSQTGSPCVLTISLGKKNLQACAGPIIQPRSGNCRSWIVPNLLRVNKSPSGQTWETG